MLWEKHGYLRWIRRANKGFWHKNLACEIDVMACIMNGRTSKKSIATTLGINYSTAAALLIRHILSKIQHSSWKGFVSL